MTVETKGKQGIYFLVIGILVVAVAGMGYALYQERQSKHIAGFQATANGETFRLEVTEDGIETSTENAR